MSAREREQLASEEARLAQLLEAPTPKGTDALNAATEALTASFEKVKRLRDRIREPSTEDRGRALAARGQVEAELRAKREERAKHEPARKAANRLLSFADPELAGARLDASRLSESEGEELLALVEQRWDGALSDRKRRRMEKLVGKLAGSETLFEDKRREADAAQAERKATLRARLDAMPERTFTGKGGAYLPAAIFASLTDPRDGTLTVTDAGVLAAVLLGIEHGEAPFMGATIDAGTIVLDAGRGCQLRPGMTDDCTGASRVRDSIAYLAELGWLTLSTEAGTTRVGLGARARKVLETASA